MFASMRSIAFAVGLGATTIVVGSVQPVDPLGAATPLHGQVFPLGTKATSQQWITLHRGARVLPTLVISPKLPPRSVVPLLVFAHGWNNNPQGYRTILTSWASAGFLVVAPTSPGMALGLPLTSETAGNQAQLSDLPSVLSTMLSTTHTLTIDRSEVVYAGHSDGAQAVATLAFNPALRDDRARAFVILAGARVPQNDRWSGSNNRPVYIAASYNDEWGNWPSSAFFFTHARSPKVLVGIGRGERHLPPWTVSSAFHRAIWESTIDFCRLSFTGEPSARAAMLHDLSLQGISVKVG
jgi:dienelactone hydrolase